MEVEFRAFEIIVSSKATLIGGYILQLLDAPGQNGLIQERIEMPAERKANVEDRNRLASPKKRDQRKGHDHMSDTSAEDNLNLCPRVTCRSHRPSSEECREMT